MALIYDTLRTNLLALFAWLGVIALAVLLWNFGSAIADTLRIREEIARGSETDVIILLSYELRREDMAMFQALSGEPPLIPLSENAAATDRAFKRAEEVLGAHRDADHAATIALITEVASNLTESRATAKAALAASEEERITARRTWRKVLDHAYPAIERLSHDVITETGDSAIRTARITALRYYALFAFRSLIANRFAVEEALAAPAPDAMGLLDLATPASELRGAANLAEDQFVAERSPAFRQAAKTTATLLDTYLPAEAAVIRAISRGKADPATLATWRTASRSAIQSLTLTEEALSAEADLRLDLARKKIHAAIGLWVAALVLCLTLLVSAVHFTLRRIIKPLENIHARMIRLAHDDLSVDLSTRSRMAEIQAMWDALAVFKEKGQRRERMQAELARLNDRVVMANQTMIAELEAAARVQAAQLPAPCDLPGAAFQTLYRPSQMIAGDTYDFITLPDGRTRLFQIDVSGHGAAAALVSVMSHIAVKSALEQAAPDDGLAQIIARVNGHWKEDLPYFTLLLVEIDPRAGIARIVQAGHPPLIRLPRTGGVETVGEGGMPVGALPWAEYEEVTCNFLPGDRLVLTTDGVTEAADMHGTLFGDDRYLTLLAQHGRAKVKTLFDAIDTSLWDWCGTEAFDDDVTVLILEAKEPAYAH